MEISQVRAVPNQCIIERIPDDEKTASGIFLPNANNPRDPIAKGKILSVGKCYHEESKVDFEPELQVGDIVIYRRNAFAIEVPNGMGNYFAVPIGRIEMVIGHE